MYATGGGWRVHPKCVQLDAGGEGCHTSCVSTHLRCLFSCFWQHFCLMMSCFICRNLTFPFSSSEMVIFLQRDKFLSSRNKLFLGSLVGLHIFFLFFCLSFLSRTFTIHRTAGEGGGYISLTPLYNFHQLHRHLGISRAITAESSPLYIASSRTRIWNRAQVANH